MNISKQKSHVSKWGYYNWSSTSWTAGKDFEKPKFHISFYLGKIWIHFIM